MNYPKVYIRRNRLDAMQRRHPWIFSGAIQKMDPCADGDVVEVVDPKGQFLAVGYYQDGSIMVRILSFEPVKIDKTYWGKIVEDAMAVRLLNGLPGENTNAFRLIHGEGDGVPGLVVDVYNDVAVIQSHAIGIHQRREDIAQAIVDNSNGLIKACYDKSKATLPQEYASRLKDGWLIGDRTEKIEILENGHRFVVDPIEGQKTGFFLDQRDNRALLGQFAKGKKILNLYAYTGGFSIYALNQRADEVVSVDISDTAIQLLKENIEANDITSKHEGLAANVKHYLSDCPKDYFDIIVVDPPAFAKSQRKRHNAVQAYKRINAMAMNCVKPGGLIFTFSCSQVVDSALFANTITAAAIETGRPARILYRMTQGADHPVSLFHPEGEYLKGLVVRVS